MHPRVKIAFNRTICGRYLKRLHNDILRSQNKPIKASNLLLKNQEFIPTIAFLQQTDISANVFPETMRIPTNNSKQTNIRSHNFPINNSLFAANEYSLNKTFSEKLRISTNNINVINKTIVEFTRINLI